jgi:hypothetical protein
MTPVSSQQRGSPPKQRHVPQEQSRRAMRDATRSPDAGTFSRQLLTLAIAPDVAGCWVELRLQLEAPGGDVFAFAATLDAEGTAPHNRFELREEATQRQRATRHLAAIRFLPERTATITVEILSREPLVHALPVLRIRARPRWRAALTLLRRQPERLRGLLGDMRSAPPGAWPGLLRRRLAAPEAPRRDPVLEYQAWVEMFDGGEGVTAPHLARLGIGVLVFASAGRYAEEALSDTLTSLSAQSVTPREVIVLRPDDKARLPGGRYVALLQAGEILPAHAIATAAEAIGRRGFPEVAIADEDALSHQGRRVSPLFKPEPNRALMLSGTLASGLWLFRRDTLEGLGIPSAASAEVARLDLWFRMHEQRGVSGVRLPFILCHRGPRTQAAPPAMLAAPVAAHLQRVRAPMQVVPGTPLALSLDQVRLPAVDVVVPSSLRRRHSLACLRAVLLGTDYPDLRLHVGVAQPDAMDTGQEGAAQALRSLGACVTPLTMERFNFSSVVNALAARGRAEYVLLLNDDIAPIGRDWLRWMVSFLQDQRTAAVGARLLYPDGSVQHGGVLMGLGGLCEHAHRGLPKDAPGYASRAVLAQELSAVTAACMLVRRNRFEELGGLDESYPSAFNDIDFCLRLREAGHAVVYAPQAELTHLELQTYGSHYAGARAAHQAEETARMLRRWSAVIRNDPFHNPNLRLEPGQEWRPAFPPRVNASAPAP